LKIRKSHLHKIIYRPQSPTEIAREKVPYNSTSHVPVIRFEDDWRQNKSKEGCPSNPT